MFTLTTLSPRAGSMVLADYTDFKISPFLTALSGLRYMNRPPQFPPETRRFMQLETWRFGGGGVNRSNT